MSSRATRKLSPEMAARMEEVVENMSAAPGERAEGVAGPRRALSFARMAGVGEKIEIGGKTYELAALPMVTQAEMHRMLSTNALILCLVMLTVSTNAESGEYDYDEAASAMSGRLKDGDGKELDLDGAALDVFVSGMINPVSAKDAGAMAEVVALSLQRRHAGITPEDILPALDIPTFALVVEKIVSLNPGFTTRF